MSAPSMLNLGEEPIIYPDGSVSAEIERAAIASFEVDNMGPTLEWDRDLDEESRSFHRMTAIAVIESFLGYEVGPRGAGLRH